VDKLESRGNTLMEGGTSVREQPVMDLSSPAAREKRQRRSPCESSAASDDTDPAKLSTCRPRFHKTACHHVPAQVPQTEEP
jgi:hypothetical protein